MKSKFMFSGIAFIAIMLVALVTLLFVPPEACADDGGGGTTALSKTMVNGAFPVLFSLHDGHSGACYCQDVGHSKIFLRPASVAPDHPVGGETILCDSATGQNGRGCRGHAPFVGEQKHARRHAASIVESLAVGAKLTDL